jgi:hypothetical protein
MDTPYVISADIGLLVKKWADKNSFVSPCGVFFEELRVNFSKFMRKIFPCFEIVPEKEILEGTSNLVAKTNLPVISLDRVYSSYGVNLDIARAINKDWNNKGLRCRAGTPSLLKQFSSLKMLGIKEAVLVDDVVFSGDLIERVTDLLLKIGINIPIVCCGIGIEEGIQRIKKIKKEIRCTRVYSQVIDEVCERDFYPGVLYSGRLLAGSENIGMPYVLPFGNPESWASIPTKHQKNFSKFCIRQAINLFCEIERVSQKTVTCRDINRKLMGMPNDGSRFADFLKNLS